MQDTLCWYGTAMLIPAVLLLVAGAGWRKMVKGLLLSLLVAFMGAMLVGVTTFKIGYALDRSGEWRGFAALVIGALAGIAIFFILLIAAIWWLVRTKRMTRERAPMLPVLFGVGGAGAILAVVSIAYAVIGNIPSLTSTGRLTRQLGHGWPSPERENELRRRGPAVVPVLLAELHRHPYSRNDNLAPSQVPPLLHVLGQIHEPEATAELHRWAASDTWETLRVAAVCALAEQGDRSAAPFIVEFLAKPNGDWVWQHAELLRALGQLKAGEHLRAIRSALSVQTPGMNPLVMQAGVSALAAIDTDEAWALIAELSAGEDKGLRSAVLNALETVRGPRSLAILAKALDDPDPVVRESAYVVLLRVEPKLQGELDWRWSETNAQILRESLKTLPLPNP